MISRISDAAQAARQRAMEAAREAAEAAARRRAEAARERAEQAARQAQAEAQATRQGDRYEQPQGERNRDGSHTLSTESSANGATQRAELTTSRNHVRLEANTQEPSGEGTRERTLSVDAQRDGLRRVTSTASETVSEQQGNVSASQSHSIATNQYGQQSVTRSNSVSVQNEGNTLTGTRSTTEGPLGTRETTDSLRAEEVSGRTTTALSQTHVQGSNVQVGHTQGMESGTFRVNDSVDYSRGRSASVSGERTWERRAPTADEGFSQRQRGGLQGGLDLAQRAGGMLAGAGLKKEWKGEEWDTTGLDELQGENVAFAGGKAGTSGSSSVSVGADGVNAEFKREAVAGLYAQKNGTVEGQYGTASYQTGAKVEARAGVDAQGKVDLNGLDASVEARAGVSAEASAGGSVESKPLTTVGDVDVTVGAEGEVRVAAQAEAHASGGATITRNPPTAIAEGEAGASAVAKAEGDVTASAGPFAITATGYVSAGAEAKASGAIGFEDGKLKLSGSLGAAVGLGAGGSAGIEIDVAEIGNMAKGLAEDVADLDGDGKLGLGDAKAGLSAVGHAASNVVSGAADKVRSFLHW